MHHYGPDVFLIQDLSMLSRLTKASTSSCDQPIMNQIIKSLYRDMMNVVAQQCFETQIQSVPTRMSEKHPEHAVFHGELLHPEQKVVICGMARAGTLPSMEIFEQLSLTLNSKYVRADHIAMNRVTNAQEKVEDALIHGHKIGGPIENAWVLLPDPMGATGSSICNVIDLYKKSVDGRAKAYISINLIITPEFIAQVHRKHPGTKIFALRLDRGFSSERALQSIPGSYPEEEKGLNEIDYIVPGAGGLGELMNNSWT